MYLSASSLSVSTSRVPDTSIGSDSSAVIVYLLAASLSQRSWGSPSAFEMTVTLSATRKAE